MSSPLRTSSPRTTWLLPTNHLLRKLLPFPPRSRTLPRLRRRQTKPFLPQASNPQDERPDDAPTPILLLEPPLDPSAAEPLSAPEPRLTLVEITEEEVLVENIQAEVLPFQPLPAAQQPKITQVKAMRQALADLGLGAKNADLANYLRDKFGMVPKNIAVLKATAKKSLFKRDEKQPEPPVITEPQTEEVWLRPRKK